MNDNSDFYVIYLQLSTVQWTPKNFYISVQHSSPGMCTSGHISAWFRTNPSKKHKKGTGIRPDLKLFVQNRAKLCAERSYLPAGYSKYVGSVKFTYSGPNFKGYEISHNYLRRLYQDYPDTSVTKEIKKVNNNIILGSYIYSCRTPKGNIK